MQTMIDTPSGVEIIFNKRDFVDVVRYNISDSAAEYLNDQLFFDEAALKAEKEVERDELAFMLENEELRTAMTDIKEELEKILDLPRICRVTVERRLNLCLKILDEYI